MTSTPTPEPTIQHENDDDIQLDENDIEILCDVPSTKQKNAILFEEIIQPFDVLRKRDEIKQKCCCIKCICEYTFQCVMKITIAIAS